MSDQILLKEDYKKYKRGQLIEVNLKLSSGIIDEHNDFIPRENFVYLTESLSKSDEDAIRRIVREILKKMFWRIYTRSGFIVQ